jgi:hypothetical protein
MAPKKIECRDLAFARLLANQRPSHEMGKLTDELRKVSAEIMAPPIGMEWSTRGMSILVIDLIFRRCLLSIFIVVDRLKGRGERCES